MSEWVSAAGAVSAVSGSEGGKLVCAGDGRGIIRGGDSDMMSIILAEGRRDNGCVALFARVLIAMNRPGLAYRMDSTRTCPGLTYMMHSTHTCSISSLQLNLGTFFSATTMMPTCGNVDGHR